MDILAILSLVARYGPIIGRVIGAASSNSDIATKIDQLGPDVSNVLKDIGGKFFPRAAPDVQVVAGATAVDIQGVAGLQTLLNQKLNAGLTVDGIYGSATRDAVSKFQSANGLKVDGVAGTNTKAALLKL